MQDKNTSTRLCAKNVGGGGGLCVREAYFWDTTVLALRNGANSSTKYPQP